MKTTNSNHIERHTANHIISPQNKQISNQNNREENYENILSQLEETREEIHSIITRHRVNHVLNKARNFEPSVY